MNSFAVFESIAERINQELNKAQKSIKIAVAWFTNKKLFDTLVSKSISGCKIELIILDDEINRGSRIDFDLLKKKNSKIYKISESEKELMHNKFCIIDNSIVISGSYNWSYKAERNFENVIITYDNVKLATQFRNEFTKIIKLTISKNRIREKSDHIISHQNKIQSLEQQLNSAINERYSIEEKIFDFSKLFLEDLYDPLSELIKSEKMKGRGNNTITESLQELNHFNNLIRQFKDIELKKPKLLLKWDKIRRMEDEELKKLILNLEFALEAVNGFNEIKNDHKITFILDKDKSAGYINNVQKLLGIINK